MLICKHQQLLHFVQLSAVFFTRPVGGDHHSPPVKTSKILRLDVSRIECMELSGDPEKQYLTIFMQSGCSHMVEFDDIAKNLFEGNHEQLELTTVITTVMQVDNNE